MATKDYQAGVARGSVPNPILLPHSDRVPLMRLPFPSQAFTDYEAGVARDSRYRNRYESRLCDSRSQPQAFPLCLVLHR